MSKIETVATAWPEAHTWAPPQASPDDGTTAADVGNLALDSDSTNPSSSDDCSRPGDRRSNAREKQRANRQLKRQLKRDHGAAGAAESERQESGRRHRPHPVERSMIFLLKMHGWSRLFIAGDAWLSDLQSQRNLDRATAAAISRALRQGLPGEGWAPTPIFRSVADLDRLAEAKSSEVAYMEKQLGVMPSLRDPAWDAYCARLASSPPAVEALEAPADLLRQTVVPCLRAQAQSLKARAERSRALEQKHDKLRRAWELQGELCELVQHLRRHQALLIPVCPVWSKFEMDIKEAEKEILDAAALRTLHEDKERAWAEYQAALNPPCAL